MNRNGITGQFVVDIVSSLAEVFTTCREKMWGFLHEAQQTLDLKFGDQLKMKSTSWLDFTFLAVPAHNPIFFARARAQKVTIGWKLNLTGYNQRVLHSPLLHHKKKLHLLWRFVLDGSWPWNIVYFKRREKKNRQSKRVSPFLQQ